MPDIDIAKLREDLGDGDKPISQEELGRRLGGVDQATISRWETGASNPPKSAVVLLKRLRDRTRPKRDDSPDSHTSKMIGAQQ